MSMFDFFGKDPRTLFLEFSPQGSTWNVVSWNFDLKKPTDRLWTIEVHKQESESIEWSRTSVEEVKFFKAEKLIRKRRVPKNKKEFTFSFF